MEPTDRLFLCKMLGSLTSSVSKDDRERFAFLIDKTFGMEELTEMNVLVDADSLIEEYTDYLALHEALHRVNELVLRNGYKISLDTTKGTISAK